MTMRLRHGLTVLAFCLSVLPAAAQVQCLDFGSVAPLGPYNGGRYELNANTNIDVGLVEYWATRSAPEPFGGATVTSTSCFNGSRAVGLSNVNLAMTITQRRPDARLININFCTVGLKENISARKQRPPDYIGESRRAPQQPIPDHLGGTVTMDISGGSSTGVYEGKLILNAPNDLQTLIYGGQEVYVVSVCINE